MPELKTLRVCVWSECPKSQYVRQDPGEFRVSDELIQAEASCQKESWKRENEGRLSRGARGGT